MKTHFLEILAQGEQGEDNVRIAMHTEEFDGYKYRLQFVKTIYSFMG